MALNHRCAAVERPRRGDRTSRLDLAHHRDGHGSAAIFGSRSCVATLGDSFISLICPSKGGQGLAPAVEEERHVRVPERTAVRFVVPAAPRRRWRWWIVGVKAEASKWKVGGGVPAAMAWGIAVAA